MRFKQTLLTALFVNLLLMGSLHNPKFTMKVNPKEKACIIEALWHEARGESKQGINAVLTVIQNRVKSESYPNSYCAVIHQHGQFTYNPAHRYKKPIANGQERAILAFVEGLASEALEGKLKLMFHPTVLWYHTHKVKPQWSKRMKLVKIIGNHKFYIKG